MTACYEWSLLRNSRGHGTFDRREGSPRRRGENRRTKRESRRDRYRLAKSMHPHVPAALRSYLHHHHHHHRHHHHHATKTTTFWRCSASPVATPRRLTSAVCNVYRSRGWFYWSPLATPSTPFTPRLRGVSFHRGTWTRWCSRVHDTGRDLLRIDLPRLWNSPGSNSTTITDRIRRGEVFTRRTNVGKLYSFLSFFFVY